MKYATPELAYKKYREDPAAFFDDVIHAESSDETELISDGWPRSWSRYHYNLVENGIIRMLRSAGTDMSSARVLDVGTGTGHWVDFYREVFRVPSITSVDFSERAVAEVAARTAGAPNVTIRRVDITKHEPDWDASFRVVNAIGVMFHIVDDQAWSRAIHHLATYLEPGGVAIFGGDFSDETRERGVMRRTRAIAEWREQLASAGLEEHALERYDWWAGADADGITDNLLAVRRP